MSSKFKKEVFEWIKTIVLALVLATAITSVVAPTIVSGQSMYPTLKNKDYLFVNKLAYKTKEPQRGDIIVFKTDLVDSKSGKNKDLVKRVIALPGDHLVIKNNKVIINDKVIEEKYIHDVYTDGDIDMVIPQNYIFTMGDNRPESGDSRQSNLGAINIDDIIGKVVLRVYPFNTLGKIN